MRVSVTDHRVATADGVVPGFVLGLFEEAAELVPAIFAVVEDGRGHPVDAVDCGDRLFAEALLLERVDVAPAVLAGDRHHRTVADQEAPDLAVLLRRQRSDPAALAEASEMDPLRIDLGARAQELDCGDGVVRQDVEVLQVAALGLAGTALVVGEGGDAVGGVEVGVVVGVDGALLARAVDQNSDRVGAGRGGCDQLAAQGELAARKEDDLLRQIEALGGLRADLGMLPAEPGGATLGVDPELDLDLDRLPLGPARPRLVAPLPDRPQRPALAALEAVA